MPATANPLTASQAGGAAAAVLITAFFGGLWGLTGVLALPDAYSSVAILVVAVVTVALVVAAARFLRLSRRPARPSGGAGTNPFATRAYRLAVLFEAIAIPVAAIVLNNAGHPGAVVSAVAAIVGLHFFGLVSAFRSRRFAAVGGAMVFIAAFSLLLPGWVSGASPRGAVVGLGCAFVLWVGILPFVLSAGRGANT